MDCHGLPWIAVDCRDLCLTLLSADNRQKTAADEWIKKVISGDTMSKATGLLEEQVPRNTARPPHAPPHAHRTRTARAPYALSISPYPSPPPPPPQVALFGECVLSEDSTPSNCQQLEQALSELQEAIETCQVDKPEDCDTEEVASALKADPAPEGAVAKPAKSGAKRRAVKNLLHMLTLGLFKTKLSPYQAPTYPPIACHRSPVHPRIHACIFEPPPRTHACMFNWPHANAAGGELPRSSGGGGPRSQGRVEGRPRGAAQGGRRARRHHPERGHQYPALLAWAGQQVGRVTGAPQEVNSIEAALRWFSTRTCLYTLTHSYIEIRVILLRIAASCICMRCCACYLSYLLG